MKGQSRSSRPAILILVTQLERAGAQKVALAQARYLHLRGYKVILCFFYDKYGTIETVQSREPFPVLSLNARLPERSRVRNSLQAVGSLVRLYRLLRYEQIDVIETLTPYSNLLGTLVAWLARVPVRVSSQRNALLAFPGWFLRLDALVMNSRVVDRVVAVSEHTRAFCVEVEGVRPEKLTVITNGINLADFERAQWSADELSESRSALELTMNARIVITVARLHPQKGHSYLIQAAQEVMQNDDNVFFLFVGDGESRSEIQEQIDRAGLGDSVRLLGIRADVPRLLAISDLFVLPSLYEGMPNVVLEAMAVELPVVATSVDGSREVVVDGVTGFLVPKEDPGALATAVQTLLQDESLRKRMGLQGCRRVETDFSEEFMCGQYETMLRSVWEKKTGAADLPQRYD